MSDLLVTSEVAKLFHVSRETIHYWCRTGRLPSYRTAGGHRRFDSQVIRRILAEMDPGQPRGAVGLPPKLAESPVVETVEVSAPADVNADEADLYAAALDAQPVTSPDVVSEAADRDDLGDMALALDIRTVIGRAEGVLMERYNLTVDQALAVLERDSRSNHQPVHDSAGQLIARSRSRSEQVDDEPMDTEVPAISTPAGTDEATRS